MIAAKLTLACAIAALLVGEHPLTVLVLLVAAYLLSVRRGAVGSSQNGW